MVKIYQIVNTGILVTFKPFSEKLKSKSLPLLHLNICSLLKNFDEFCILLTEININFDIIALTESRIKKTCFPNKCWTGELLNWAYTNWDSSWWSFTLNQQKAFLSSKKWFEYLYAWQTGIYFYWNCMPYVIKQDYWMYL